MKILLALILHVYCMSQMEFQSTIMNARKKVSSIIENSTQSEVRKAKRNQLVLQRTAFVRKFKGAYQVMTL